VLVQAAKLIQPRRGGHGLARGLLETLDEHQRQFLGCALPHALVGHGHL